MIWVKKWSKPFKNKKLSQVMLSQLIRLQVKFLRQEEALPELHNMMLWVLKPDSLTALKDKSKREKKSFTQLLYMKLMLSIQDLKDFWHCFQEQQVKLHKKLDNKLIRKSQNGENKVKQKSFQVFCSSMRSICWIWNVFHFWTEP